MFGSPETTTGGNALKFYSSVRLDIRRIGAVKNGDEVVGNETRVKVVKNKVAPPFRQTEFQIFTAQEFTERVKYSNSASSKVSLRSQVRGMHIMVTALTGSEKCSGLPDDNPEMKEEIEATIRQQLMPYLSSEEDSAEVLIPEASQEGLS